MTATNERLPDVVPMLAYEDTARAMAWLAEAFGFRERFRMPGPDNRVSQAAMHAGRGVVMMADVGHGYQAPRHHAECCDIARGWLSSPNVIDGVLVHIDGDLDAHHQQAKRVGAEILSPPEDGPPGRLYRAADCEGHRWMFLATTHRPA